MNRSSLFPLMSQVQTCMITLLASRHPYFYMPSSQLDPYALKGDVGGDEKKNWNKLQRLEYFSLPKGTLLFELQWGFPSRILQKAE